MKLNMRIPVLVLLAGTAVVAAAKLPAPSPEAQAKAAETSAKAAWSGKVDNHRLCLAQDRVATHYRQTAAGAKPAIATSGCTDPGPFAYTPPADKPAEAAGAHSPPGTASSPPSTTTPSASAPKPPKP